MFKKFKLSWDEVEQWLADDDTPLCETLTDDEILEVVEKDENKDGDVSDKPNEEGLSHSEAYFSLQIRLQVEGAAEGVQRYSTDASETYSRCLCTEEAVFIKAETYYRF
ncbi:hypothetical protein T07_4124 [Trichinella nelsoni]|uniref:Uncharacterized protein n=1 Tax=Trichinella nelsoni TaxID=6336 RepID=A0A0V0S195_9BILA|nr:hypothetical protein T07_4124 [Trichinella nelsoni]